MVLSFHVLQMQTEVERQKVVSKFRQLRRFLKDQELALLARLGELDREMMRREEEEETKTSGEISLLDTLICEMERMLEQPASRFLQVGCSTGQDGRGSGITLAGVFLQFWDGRLRLFSLSFYSRMPEALWTGTSSSTTHVSTVGEGSQAASPWFLEQRWKFWQFRQGLRRGSERCEDKKVPLNPGVGMP